MNTFESLSLALAISTTAACTPTTPNPVTIKIAEQKQELPSADPKPNMVIPATLSKKPATTAFTIGRCIEAKLGTDGVEQVRLECKVSTDNAQTCKDQVVDEVFNNHADQNAPNFISDCKAYIDIANSPEGVEDTVLLNKCMSKVELNYPGEVAQHKKDLSKRVSACLEGADKCYRDFASQHKLSCTK